MKGERSKSSSLTLPKVKATDDEPESSKQAGNNKENVKPSTVEKLPAIGKQSNPERRRQSNESKDTNHGRNGKAKRSPKKNMFVKRLSNGERVTRTLPDEEGDIGDGEKKLTPETTLLRWTGGIELVPLLARKRRVGARTLHSSDVTRPPDQSCE